MASWPPGAVLGGRYRVLRTIDESAHSTVLAARDLESKTGALVALKIVLVDSDGRVAAADAVRSELASARALCGVDPHPHLARLLDVFVQGGGGGGGGGDGAGTGPHPHPHPHHPRLVMAWELVAGPDLLALIAACPGRRLPEPLAAALIAQLAAGLAAMHAAGVAHRDVKPENAVLDARSGAVKVIDFGLAAPLGGGGGGGSGPGAPRSESGGQASTATPTPAWAGVGTPAYMAPEALPGWLGAQSPSPSPGRQPPSAFAGASSPPPRPPVRGALDGAAVDAWGVGATLYAMVTGALPFVDPAHPGSAHHTLAAVAAAAGPRPGPLARAGVSAACRDLIASLLARDPRARARVADVATHPWVVAMAAPARAAEAAAAQAAALAAHAAEWGAGALEACASPRAGAASTHPRRHSLDGEAGGPGVPLASSVSVPPLTASPAAAPMSRASSAGTGAVDELLGGGLQAWLSDLAGGRGSDASEPGWASRSPALPRISSAGVGVGRARTSSASEAGAPPLPPPAPASPPALTPSASDDSLADRSSSGGGGPPSPASDADAERAAAEAAEAAAASAAAALEAAKLGPPAPGTAPPPPGWATAAAVPTPPAVGAPHHPPTTDSDSFYHPYGSGGSSGGGELEDDWDDPWLHGDDIDDGLPPPVAAGLLGTGPWSGGGAGRGGGGHAALCPPAPLTGPPGGSTPPAAPGADSPPPSGASAWSAASLASAVSLYSHGGADGSGELGAAVAAALAAGPPSPAQPAGPPPAAAAPPSARARAAVLAALAKPSPSSVSEAVAALKAASQAAGGPPGSCLLREYLAKRRAAAACGRAASLAASLSGSQRSLSGSGRPPAAPSPKRPAGRFGSFSADAEPAAVSRRAVAPALPGQRAKPAHAARQPLFRIERVPSAD